ncbi:quinone oxidoreductase-like protein 1 isoform X2 [Acinonyx jubatus]|uniref:Quinone oxidoreductase-like protein 1 isoform X2 n=1 Tax=Acinonyx jubatus TaxID=32536 RepID=A0ABM3PY24_ACIJB|nr:quinone oxidoreductase-like protein 1 isoform X2 [Acinonyx jubatus]
MKGLYFQKSSTNEEITFVFQERENLPITEDNYVKLQVKACALSQINTKLLAEMKMEKEFFPVGREIAGIVLDVGNKVSFFQPDDEVVGILPLDSEDPGLCEVVRVHEHYLVHKPEKVTWTEAAGTIRDGVRAYTALHYLSHLSSGKSVLIMDGASALGMIAIQLAHHRGAKVISTAGSLEDKQCLERLRPSLARVIDVSNGKAHVAESCLEETGGLGVDIVLDAGVRLYSKDDEPAVKLQLLPHKHDIITLLGVGGHWVTTEENLQVKKLKHRKVNTCPRMQLESGGTGITQTVLLVCLSWMNPFHYMRRKFPWKLFRKIKEEKSKLFNFNFVFSQTSVG